MRNGGPIMSHTDPTTPWTFSANPAAGLSPAAVAAIYGARMFDPPREVGKCWGYTVNNSYWLGHFTLRGHPETYRLWREGGLWTMEPETSKQPTGGQGQP